MRPDDPGDTEGQPADDECEKPDESWRWRYYHPIIMGGVSNVSYMSIEERTARLTVLIDPRKKAVFEQLCAEEDVTPSQMVRRLIREYIERKRGYPWTPKELKQPDPLRGTDRRTKR